MRHPSFALLVVACLASAARAQSSDGAKVYLGDEGLEVRVVFLHPRSDGNALVEVLGSASELDGKPRLHKVADDGPRTEYRGKLHGRDWYTLVGKEGRWTLYAPGVREQPVKYDDARTKALDAAAVVARYQQQTRDGSLAALEKFDRGPRMQKAEGKLRELAAAVGKACGGKLSVTVDWSGIDDEVLGTLSIPSYCGAPLEAMATLCGEATAARQQLGPVTSFTCKLGAPTELALAANKLTWTVDKGASNLEEHARAALLGPEASAPPPWGKLESLAQKMALERAVLCNDNKAHLVAVVENAAGKEELYYGDGRKMVLVPSLPYLGGGYFFEPRFVNATANPSFRGHDMRLVSEVEVKRGENACAVRCGTRTIALPIVPAQAASLVLTSASFSPPLPRHAPHALLRDDLGNYYYVDRGTAPGKERKFRLWKGPKGALKEQKMTNVVADSEGEIFSTRTGSLRMIIDRKKPSVWIEKGKSQPLRPVPVEENLPLIYEDLGVYAGERLGTPCDDL